MLSRGSHAARNLLAGALLLISAGAIAGACAASDPVNASGPPAGPQSGGTACLLHDCTNDDECGGCTEGRTSCLVDERRCVACDPKTGSGCPSGTYCSPYGNCAPDGVTCPTDAHGTPTISCTTSADCAACDPAHLICDNTTGKCVGCTPVDTSECNQTDICVNGACSAKCPSECMTDNDCGLCDSSGFKAHACNAHRCAECSPTYACPTGQHCTDQGVCAAECGTDSKGTCASDADCQTCGGSATVCHKPINGGTGTCGPSAAGCTDLGAGVGVLPAPWNEVTNMCSNDADCSGVGIDLNVGKILRDITGIDQIKDADIHYGMNVCASVTTGINGNSVSCGICVPCREDADCDDINIDQVALDAFGPLGSIGAAILLDQVFGSKDHVIHMYCQSVAGDYGVCAPCPGLVYDCGVGGSSEPPSSTGTCNHDVCSMGGPLSPSCDACASAVCAYDDYCCTNSWDSVCINDVSTECTTSCNQQTSPGYCVHDECTTGDALDPSCSDCTDSVCSVDAYCCDSQWDSQCVSEVDQYCSIGCSI